MDSQFHLTVVEGEGVPALLRGESRAIHADAPYIYCGKFAGNSLQKGRDKSTVAKGNGQEAMFKAGDFGESAWDECPEETHPSGVVPTGLRGQWCPCPPR